MVLIVAEVKGWQVEDKWDVIEETEWGVVRRLEDNWKIFKRGCHVDNIKETNGKSGD